MDFAFWPACALRRIHTMRRRIGDRSEGGSVPSPSQVDRARTRFSTKIGSITSYLTLNDIMTLKPGLEVTQDHSNWYYLKAWVRFRIRLL